MQLVIAGKSHPADDGGKKLIQQLVQFADDPEVRHRIVFLPDYDIGMARLLYPGCDVWLNNPLRPLEACGTSGMKAALNGGLNLSILDGWWDEWYDGENGWAIPTADGVDDPDRRDDLEAAALYDLVEKSVAPRFYDRRRRGPADPLDHDAPAHAGDARPQGARLADGARLRQQALRAGGASSSRAVLADDAALAKELAAYADQGARGVGRACGSSTSRPPASATRPSAATQLSRARLRRPRRAHARRRPGRARERPGRPQRPHRVDPTFTRARRRPSPTRQPLALRGAP